MTYSLKALEEYVYSEFIPDCEPFLYEKKHRQAKGIAEWVRNLLEKVAFDVAMIGASEKILLIPDLCEGSPVPEDRFLAERVVDKILGARGSS